MDHYGTAVRTRNRALDSDKVVLGVHLDNLQILNGDSLASQMPAIFLPGYTLEGSEQEPMEPPWRATGPEP